MDLWQRARGFAEEAAKRSQELVAETAKKSQEIAAEAAKKADLFRSEALRAADQIKATIAADVTPLVIPPAISSAINGSQGSNGAAGLPDLGAELEKFGVTEELREFVRGITLSTFRDFPMKDEPVISEVPTVSNVRQDLNEWQAKHATLVLSSVKEMSKFRYELCPRYMKEKKFWRIYFILVSSFISPYERKYMEDLEKERQQKQELEKERQKMQEQEKDRLQKQEQEKERQQKQELEKERQQKQINTVKDHPATADATVVEEKQRKLQSKTSTSSNAKLDLDFFLLGDLGSDDEGPENGADGFDDDFDEIDHNSGLVSDDDDDIKI